MKYNHNQRKPFKKVDIDAPGRTVPASESKPNHFNIPLSGSVDSHLDLNSQPGIKPDPELFNAPPKAEEEVKLFTLEKVPFPQKAGKESLEKWKQQATELASKMKVLDEAFVIPSTSAAAIRAHLKEQYPQYAFRFSAIKPGRRFTRIWRTA